MTWIDAQTVETLYLSAVTQAELRFRLVIIPEGKSPANYQDRFETEVLPTFAGRVLPFDLAASQTYAELIARAMAARLAIGKADSYIAAKTSTCGFMVATLATQTLSTNHEPRGDSQNGPALADAGLVS